MIAKDSGSVAQTRQAAGTAKAGIAVEAVHLAGSALVTGGLAVVLTAIAVPVSVGMGVTWGVRTLAKKLRGNDQ
ncbi:hypothetical protein [Rhizorhapis suberifaciens]|uniref:Uncharacterized protein n=1 Tax=Rhizorhapis suberifaciens TaxID=13656 RepID=A0A840HRM5_9SPHN|nr:hypothetical protein [Rhizorhapis suberifaciens]MBB4640194.1 hypothetical protein [Rhizorhapis suberifaciens]